MGVKGEMVEVTEGAEEDAVEVKKAVEVKTEIAEAE